MSGIEVLRAGALTTVQDLGRPGLAHIGVPRSGAADLPALLRANALTGNEPGAAALETTLTGPSLRFCRPAVIALAGAPAPTTLDGRALAFGQSHSVAAGAVLDVGTATAGLRTYVAVRGGIEVTPVLGSRSFDTLTGLGPRPLAKGDVLGVGTSVTPGAALGVGISARPGASGPETGGGISPVGGRQVLRVATGPREDLFERGALATLTTQEYVVSPTSSRVGVRLTGPPLDRADSSELLSEGVARGAVQVPPSGAPIVMLADHPTTGGYPVIAVVVDADQGRVGQLRPGQTVRFERTS